MIHRSIAGLLCASLAIFPARGAAYEVRTHGSLTAAAFDASQALAKYLEDIGITAGDVFDPASRAFAEQLAGFDNTGTPRDWMIEGAIREDDFQHHPTLTLLGCDAPRNPLSQIDRPLRHFFDVQRGGRGLSVGPLSAIAAPEWALGQQGRGPGPTANQFSLPDARLYQLRSLTEPLVEERERHTALFFRTLGQVLHMLQDVAQPQHTRNDPHTGCLDVIAGEHSWYEDYLERRALGQRFRQRADQPFPLPLAGYPAPRFTTYREFFSHPERKGLADFSSRNFFSAGTNLSLFGSCGGLPEPPCQRDAYGQRNVPFSFVAVDGTSVAGAVGLFLRTVPDPLTGGAVPDVAVSSRSLWDQHLERRGLLPVFTLNTLNYDAISDVLIPRAVGYSVGFLDHVFRGRLDVDLIEDPLDPSIVRLEGTNASPVGLEDGTLSLLVEDPSSRLRQPVEALDDARTVTAPPGALVRSARFQLPPEAERFVAVYQGALGGEEAPGENAPGAVIGKILGGLRVEQVLLDFDTGLWKLRTPRGVFVLRVAGATAPLTQADFEDMRWGDGDRLIGRSPIGPGQPNRVVAYTVRRDAASPLGLVTEPSPDGPVVRLVEQARAPVPSALGLGTSVAMAHTIHYRQQMVTADLRATWVFRPETGLYELGDHSFTTGVRVVADESLVFNADFPLVLDLAHYITAFSPLTTQPSYAWFMQDVAMNGAGHLVALVGVFLVGPRDNRVVRPFFELEGPGTGELRSTPIDIGEAFPMSGAMLTWALVDLTAGRVLGSTAGPSITFASSSSVQAPQWMPFALGPRPKVYLRTVTDFVGGPQDGDDDDFTTGLALSEPDEDQPYDQEEDLAVEIAGSSAVSGLLRGDLQAALAGLSRTTSGDSSHLARWEFGGRLLVRVDGRVTGASHAEAQVGGAVRARESNDRLVLIASGRAGGHNVDALVAWDPLPARAELAFVLAPRDQDVGSELGLTAATERVALVNAAAHGGAYLVALDGRFPPRFFADPSALGSFTLLGSGLLYDTQTQRFFRGEPPLRRTALPARLAPMASQPFGDFHAIRLGE